MAVKTISVDQLCVGLYVLLDVGWLQHSFARNSFTIKNDEQIAAIRKLGLKTIRVESALCECPPLPLEKPATSPPQQEIAEPGLEEMAVIREKKERIEKIVKEQAIIAQCEKEFQKSASALKTITRNLFARPEVALKEADQLTLQLTDSLLGDKDIIIHLMNDKIAGEEVFYHSLNIAVLSMMLGKEMGLSGEDIKLLGLGCLFHDIGKVEIPDRIVNKKFELTKAEQNLMQQHCHYGVKIGEKIGLPQGALDVIMQHHEYIDGSGYPAHLTNENISQLARITSVINAYDNQCNKPNPSDSLTPYEALVHMFAHQRKQLDATALNLFIRCMGVYPPGTVVKLSDGTFGLVVSVNSNKPLRPSIAIYDPCVPKNEAIILDLGNEPELQIASNIKPSQLPPAVYAYLSPRKRMSYYFETQIAQANKKT